MKKSSLSNNDYEELKKFFIAYVDFFVPPHQKSRNPEDQPLVFFANLERKSMANAKKGLQMAVNDVVEMTVDWSPTQVAEADEKFGGQGIISLSEVRRRYSRKYLGVIERGLIESEEEYYLLKGVADGSGIEAGAIEVAHVESMLAEYERRIVAQFKAGKP